MTDKEIQRINATYYRMNSNGKSASIREVADAVGWSTSTVRKYLDYNWKPIAEQKRIEGGAKPGISFSNVMFDLDEVKKKSGLYMFLSVQIGFSSILLGILEERPVYLIKIGQAKDLKRRIQDYKTENPLACCCSFYEEDIENLNKSEEICHNFLDKIGRQVNNTEWYAVSKETWDSFRYNGFRVITTNII